MSMLRDRRNNTIGKSGDPRKYDGYGREAAERSSSPALPEAKHVLCYVDKHEINTNFCHVRQRPVQRLVRWQRSWTYETIDGVT